MRLADFLTVVVLAASLSGCAICESPFDDYFAAYGGSRPRSNMVHGRVASVFDPADAGTTGGTVESFEQMVTPESREAIDSEESPTTEDDTAGDIATLAAELDAFLPGAEEVPASLH